MDAVKFLNETQWKSQDEIRSIQWRKITDLVHHMYQNVPYYRRVMDHMDAPPEAFRSWEDFHRLPVLDKLGLRQNRESLLDNSRRYRYSKDSTSGSSGPSMTVYSDYGALAFQHAAVFRALAWYKVGIGAPQMRFWGVQLDRGRRWMDFLKDGVLNRRTVTTHDLSETWLERCAILVERFRPAWIYGFTSAVAEFARFLSRRGNPGELKGLKVVVVTGERCSPEQAQLMRDVFGVPICNEYGCAEVGPVASSCPEGNLHLNAENVLLEIDPQSESHGGIRFGEAVVTELNSRFMPLVRYRIGDVIGLGSGPCACGRGLPILASVSGRTLDFVVTPDGRRVHGIYFDYIPKYFFGEIETFQIVQPAPDRLEIRIVKASSFSEGTTERLERMLRETLGSKIGLRFEMVSEIEREPTGKYRFIKCEIPSVRAESQ